MAANGQLLINGKYAARVIHPTFHPIIILLFCDKFTIIMGVIPGAGAGLHNLLGGKWGLASKLISWLLGVEVRSCNMVSVPKTRNPRPTHHHLIPKADLRFIPRFFNHNHRTTRDSLIFPLNTV
jgi:hypothetical protein